MTSIAKHHKELSKKVPFFTSQIKMGQGVILIRKTESQTVSLRKEPFPREQEFFSY